MKLRKILIFLNLMNLQLTNTIIELSYFCENFFLKTFQKKILYYDIIFKTFNLNEHYQNNIDIEFDYDNELNNQKNFIDYSNTINDNFDSIFINSNEDPQIIPLQSNVCFYEKKNLDENFFNFKSNYKRKPYFEDLSYLKSSKILKQELNEVKISFLASDTFDEDVYENKFFEFKEILNYISNIVENYEKESKFTKNQSISYLNSVLCSQKNYNENDCSNHKLFLKSDKCKNQILNLKNDYLENKFFFYQQYQIALNKKIILSGFNKSYENSDFVNDLIECVDSNKHVGINDLIKTYCNFGNEEINYEYKKTKLKNKIEIISDIKLNNKFCFKTSKSQNEDENYKNPINDQQLTITNNSITSFKSSNLLDNIFTFEKIKISTQNEKLYFCKDNFCDKFANIFHKKFKKSIPFDKLLLKELCFENFDSDFVTVLKRSFIVLSSYMFEILDHYVFNATKANKLIDIFKTNLSKNELSLENYYFEVKSMIKQMFKEKFSINCEINCSGNNNVIEWINNFGNKALSKFKFSFINFDKALIKKLVKYFKHHLSKRYTVFTNRDIINFLILKIKTIYPRFDRICIFQVLINILHIKNENYKLTQLIKLIFYIKIWYNKTKQDLKTELKDNKLYINRILNLIKCSYLNELCSKISCCKTFTTIINDILKSSLYVKNLQYLNHNVILEQSFLLNFLLQYDINKMNACDFALLHMRYNDKRSKQFVYNSFIQLTLKLMIDNDLLK